MASNITINLGSRFENISDLRAILRLGTVVVATISTGFASLGNGVFRLSLDVPDGVDNALITSLSEGDLCVAGISPSSAENEPPASGNENTVTAYLFTKNSSGQLTPGMTVRYRLLGADAGSGLAGNDDINTVTSDDASMVSIEMQRGGYYKYWVGNGRYRIVHIDNETSDPYALPDVTG